MLEIFNCTRNFETPQHGLHLGLLFYQLVQLDGVRLKIEGVLIGGVLGSGFAGYMPLASQNPYPIIVYSVASYRPHLSHFWANVIVISRTELNAS